MSYLLAFIGLGVLILVHEAGHMLVARAFGMRVDKFSIFFGPALLRWRGRKTTYQLGVIPLGGYVQIAGMNPNEELPDDDVGSYQNKSRFAQFSTVFAGPAVNYVFAMCLMALVLIAWGVPQWQLVVSKVHAGRPAATAGMKKGDQLHSIDGRRVRTIEQVGAAIMASGGKQQTIVVVRGGKHHALKVKPEIRQGSDKHTIGISYGGTSLGFTDVPIGTALWASIRYPFAKSGEILTGLGRLFSGKTSTKNVGGPVEIVRQLKHSFETNLPTALVFLAMLNVYLGLFNLLPLPALDGGRIVFITLAAIRRRPINQRVENMVHTVGFLLMLGLLVLISYRDLARIFG
ncbi:MAG: site-2 protease family protein [Myxococcales bacterium]|nr:site-2 protease family protein [Myxococcales bacterium]